MAETGRVRQWLAGAEHGSARALGVLWLVCLPLAFFFGQLTYDVPVHSAKAAGAAFGWYGEDGTVTVTHVKKVTKSRGGTERRCYGDFHARDGDGAAVTGVRVHLDGGCTPGRTVDVRLLRADTGSWLIDHDDEAFAGTGAGTPLVLLVFMGLFCLVVGGPFMLCALLFPCLMVLVAVRRRRARREAEHGAATGPPADQPGGSEAPGVTSADS
ncbi:hypothetical protein LO772_18375 [Yinghuangia sp. ASG 101]|uniref:hypothetical protein n=1 Tax=Yinghuangia sp. ASG 101 TaxID=2896848 RepID=UPI001E49DD95|nr:hypothetical protein [Yinghuangia sp. ASG 101]UGQ08949.1 hypothetical protein LO772_18375 [Yinghuangia sp. ASG 101]